MHLIIRWLWRRKGPSGFSYNSTAEEVTEGINGSGLTAIVTGASSGIGMETARVLALRGVHVIMAVRNLSSGSDVKEAIIKEIPNAKVDIIQLDLSSMASVRKFVADFNARSLPLNILINNAGGWSPSFELTEDEIEQTFATNHIGHFLLTDLLLENMKTTSQKTGIEGRIVIVSSDGYVLTYHEGIRFDKINDSTGYGGFASYGQSKLANIFHAQELSIHLQEQGLNITANAIHPGAIPTNIMRHSSFLNGLFTLAKYVIKSVKQGAATTCYVALNPQVQGVSGEYFSDCNLEKLKSHATNKDLAKKLWGFSMDLIKTRDCIGENI